MFLQSEQYVYQWREIAPNIWLIENGVAAEFEAQLLTTLYPELSKTVSALTQFLKHAPGHFSLVIDREDWQLGLVGRHQLFPVFFSSEGGRLNFSTDARLLNSNLKANEEIEWFAQAGFLPGRETLLEDVFQLQAGEIVMSSKDDKKWNTNFYFRHWHTSDNKLTNSSVSNELHELCLEIGHYMIQQADDSPIALSLSGGYDSRLLALILKTLGYDEVYCYTYGNPKSFEAKRAKQTAEALGFKWVFIAYSDANAELFFDDEAMRFRSYAHRGSMLPYEQDFIAVHTLKSKRLIPENSLMVVGHFADLTAGKSIPDPLEVRRLIGQGFDPTFQLCHSRLFPQLEMSQSTEAAFLASLSEIIDEPNRENAKTIIAQFENWKTLNFTVKHPNQSVRVPEFFGYRWCLPFTHPDWLRFWYAAKFQQRFRRKLFRETVEKSFFKPNGIDTSVPDFDHLIDRSSTLVRIRNVAPKSLRRIAKSLFRLSPKNQSGMGSLRRRMYRDLGEPQAFKALHSNAQYAHWLLGRLQKGEM